LGLGIGLYIGTIGGADQPRTPSAAEVIQQASNPSKQAYLSEQQKAEIELLREALAEARTVAADHRHHSQIMWNLLEGKITSREAWWQGGDSTCHGWLAAGRFEQRVAKLQGHEIVPIPIPKQGLEFCKQARERR
jgi:hypothetical protein